jgi:hypothetical protein
MPHLDQIQWPLAGQQVEHPSHVLIDERADRHGSEA